ncbi:uncharacterized protein PHACADRAFT_263157 [Phanerochaete carnosa HHB-10118-sp]|uniref:Secreted protein n=1 Tax=Phanerochaete carnosa (strain HHB-10118-sp) TaxID=650164 RepID=K5UN48_PHACS|nr:uncharacterized protein PHACADRAFT_263157 [Phanerochaete carnosa HHB-10118-sp]EKM51156.1 hypothetical protein PHACADRAFT_263157 [Phanerochaete carnosa HHB-10118-sp]
MNNAASLLLPISYAYLLNLVLTPIGDGRFCQRQLPAKFIPAAIFCVDYNKATRFEATSSTLQSAHDSSPAYLSRAL